ncbi:hypothetical protein [Nannocystis sp.]|uniref:hypothetical protein n=1 Tax=Nannocystis sp. TaxID=1962667 RepID=UPI00242393AA|nr:hypothetical protein [Nannocystis sp.]MBK7824838.1 hypothetical protein [Nannocystis sp.]MBK9752909.1 hypothetical protein [Nannocystis sp.]
MGFFRAIIDFFRRLLGLSREPVLSLGTGAHPALAAQAGDDDDDDDEVASDGNNDATRDGQLNIEDEWADLQVLIARCEAETIDLAGLDIRDPATFWARQVRIEDGQRDGKGRLHAVVAAGFRSLEHWDEVSRYYQAKWSLLARRDSGELEIRPREEFTGAALRARNSARPR